MTGLMFLAMFMVMLGIGGLISDHLFPRIRLIQQYIDGLAMMQDTYDCYGEDVIEILKEENAA